MHMNKNTVIGAIVLLIVIIGGYFLLNKQPASTETIKIGAILPLSGKASSFGEDIKSALDIAVEEINTRGQKIDIVYEDSGCDPKKAVSAFHSLFGIKKINVMIGAACSSETLAIAPLAEQNHVILITPASSAETISDAGDFIFRNHTHDKTEIAKLAPYAIEKYKNAAIFYDSTNDGIVQQQQWFSELFINLGGNIAANISMIGGGTDYRSELLKLKSKIDEIDVVFLPLLEKDATVVIKQMKELHINKPIIGNKAFATSGFVSNAGKDLAEGIVYAEAAYNENTNSVFWNKYLEKTGRKPVILAAQGYDTLKILVQIFDKCKADDTICVRDELYKIDYEGVAGIVKFDEKGDAIKEIAIKQIQNGNFVRIK